VENMGENNKVAEEILEEINKVVKGKEEVVRMVLTGILAGGHILIEDVPGVGKTTLATAFSRVMSLKYNRLQFTPDVMPSDVTGFSIYNKSTGDFEYKSGVIMCNMFLADEINRTSSKTQSALLEAMEEGAVTVDGITREIDKPFVVIATQNPVGSVGTSMLPESQLDRFMFRLSMGYPDDRSEIEMLESKSNGNPIEMLKPVIGIGELKAMQDAVSEVVANEAIREYIVKLVCETRKNPYISLGVSPRGSIAVLRAAKALAYIKGRDYVVPDDVKEIFEPVINHRIILSPQARLKKMSITSIIDEVIKKVAI
jgi:MoxR-like ATPase